MKRQKAIEECTAYGVDVRNFDTSIKPTDNFHQFSNGSWLKNNPIPPDKTAWGSYMVLIEETQQKLHGLLDEIAKEDGAPRGSNTQKLRDFYATGQDVKKLNRDGVAPLREELDRVEAIQGPEELVEAIAHLQSIGMRPLWFLDVDQDAKNAEEVILYIQQSGLGLPDRDYYIRTDKSSKEIRKQYIEHMTRMFVLLGRNAQTAERLSRTVMRIERRLAQASLTRTELRDEEAQYHKMTIRKLRSLAPTIDWDRYLRCIGARGLRKLIVRQPQFIEEVDRLFKSVSLKDWRTYLLWKLICGTADKLSDDFVNEGFSFYGTVLTGAKELKPRWQRCLMIIDRVLGEALGELYVSRYFSAEAKVKVNGMVDHLIAVYRERIRSLDWMGAKTKEKALEKLGTIVRKIGYPDKWRDYTGMDIGRDSYAGNYMHANEFEFRRMIAKLGKPVDRNEWYMSPHTVNAYYNRSMNEIVFPAGFLQPPYFDPEADDAVNYGGIGEVIGHELTHGFDDQGSKFDANGNLKNWWTKADRKRFEERARILVEQFNAYEVVGGMHINGELTLGENIADLGGLCIAYDAFQRSLKGNKRPPNIDGFTPEQRFFLGHAQGWALNVRVEDMKKRLTTDPHSPEEFRTNGPLSNMTEFYEAFGCTEGDAMYRDEKSRAKIW